MATKKKAAKTKQPKTLETPKPRGKKAKIAFLKRSAAGKKHHHRKKLRHTAFWHYRAIGLAMFFLLALGSMVVANAADLIAPPGQDINITAYQKAAEERRAALALKERAPDQVGVASWYALGLRSPDALTCASTRFPRGTYLEVTSLRNDKKIVCLVNDYGPQPYTNRVIDLSRGSFREIEWLGSGTVPVEVRVVQP